MTGWRVTSDAGEASPHRPDFPGCWECLPAWMGAGFPPLVDPCPEFSAPAEPFGPCRIKARVGAVPSRAHVCSQGAERFGLEGSSKLIPFHGQGHLPLEQLAPGSPCIPRIPCPHPRGGSAAELSTESHPYGLLEKSLFPFPPWEQQGSAQMPWIAVELLP